MGWFLELNMIVIIIFTLFMAFGALRTDKVMKAAAYLLLTLWGVAFAYLFLGSEYVFAIQLIVYGGGIVVLFLFSVLLTGHEEFQMDKEFIWNNLVQILISLLLFFTLTMLMFDVFGGYELTGNELVILNETQDLTQTLSTALFTNYNYVLPILGILLLSAMLGSIKIAIREEEL